MDNKFNNYDVIILSDYNKGVLTTNWFKRPQSAIVFLDPKKSFINFNQCDIITPNLNELKQLYFYIGYPNDKDKSNLTTIPLAGTTRLASSLWG